MKTIFLDVGNHSVKAWGLEITASEEGGSLVRLDDAGLANALHLLDGVKNEIKLVVSNVRGGDFRKQLQVLTSGWVAPRFLSMTDFPGFITRYKKPETMGIDRIVAMQGAAALYKGPLLVVDAGTVVTIDRLDASGNHMGGYFFPGLHSIRHAISAHAQHIKPVSCGPELLSEGLSTDECACSGTLLGWASAISGMITALCADESHLVVVCGGGGELLVEYMQTDQQVRFRPELVFDGMRLAVSNK